MIRRLFRYMMTAFLALIVPGMLTCCINDDIVDTANPNSDGEYYIDFTFQSSTSSPLTRAGESFEDGSHDEHRIGVSGNYALFFNKDKKFLLASDLRLKDHEEITDDNAPSADNKEEAVYRTRFYRAKKADMPKYVLVVLNGNEIRSALTNFKEGDDLSDVLSTVWTDTANPRGIGFDVEDSEGQLFTMTNSVYVENGEVHAATEIKEENIQSFSEVYDPDKITRIYVERMAAKFSFSEAKEEQEHIYYLEKTGDTTEEQVLLFDGYDDTEGSKDPDDSEDVGILKTENITDNCIIKVTGWGINALETENHPFKNIGTSNNSWSDDLYKRYHWSEDPHYDKDADNAIWRYPWQYRSAVERKDIDYYSNAGYTSPLKNFSYLQFVNETTGNVAGEDNFDRVVYTPENTYDPTLYKNKDDAYFLDKRTNLLAGTHLIICAELLINNTNQELYRDRLGVYYEKQIDCLAELIRQFNHELKTQSIMRFHYYNWNTNTHDDNDGKVFTFKSEKAFQLYEKNGENYTRATVDNLNSKFPSDITLNKATVLNGDGKLVPWTDDLISNWVIRKKEADESGVSYIAPKIYGEDYDENDDKTKDEKTNELDATNVLMSLLYEWVGAIDHFHYGKMYYAAPIMHNAANKEEEARSQNTLGDYGVVRNHWYKITLTDIVRIGTPVDVPTDPIVPNRVITNDQIHFKVDIPDWHEIVSVVPIL